MWSWRMSDEVTVTITSWKMLSSRLVRSKMALKEWAQVASWSRCFWEFEKYINHGGRRHPGKCGLTSSRVKLQKQSTSGGWLMTPTAWRWLWHFWKCHWSKRTCWINAKSELDRALTIMVGDTRQRSGFEVLLTGKSNKKAPWICKELCCSGHGFLKIAQGTTKQRSMQHQDNLLVVSFLQDVSCGIPVVPFFIVPFFFIPSSLHFQLHSVLFLALFHFSWLMTLVFFKSVYQVFILVFISSKTLHMLPCARSARPRHTLYPPHNNKYAFPIFCCAEWGSDHCSIVRCCRSEPDCDSLWSSSSIVHQSFSCWTDLNNFFGQAR